MGIYSFSGESATRKTTIEISHNTIAKGHRRGSRFLGSRNPCIENTNKAFIYYQWNDYNFFFFFGFQAHTKQTTKNIGNRLSKTICVPTFY